MLRISRVLNHPRYSGRSEKMHRFLAKAGILGSHRQFKIPLWVFWQKPQCSLLNKHFSNCFIQTNSYIVLLILVTLVKSKNPAKGVQRHGRARSVLWGDVQEMGVSVFFYLTLLIIVKFCVTFFFRMILCFYTLLFMIITIYELSSSGFCWYLKGNHFFYGQEPDAWPTRTHCWLLLWTPGGGTQSRTWGASWWPWCQFRFPIQKYHEIFNNKIMDIKTYIEISWNI